MVFRGPKTFFALSTAIAFDLCFVAKMASDGQPIDEAKKIVSTRKPTHTAKNFLKDIGLFRHKHRSKHADADSTPFEEIHGREHRHHKKRSIRQPFREAHGGGDILSEVAKVGQNSLWNTAPNNGDVNVIHPSADVASSVIPGTTLADVIAAFDKDPALFVSKIYSSLQGVKSDGDKNRMWDLSSGGVDAHPTDFSTWWDQNGIINRKAKSVGAFAFELARIADVTEVGRIYEVEKTAKSFKVDEKYNLC